MCILSTQYQWETGKGYPWKKPIASETDSEIKSIRWIKGTSHSVCYSKSHHHTGKSTVFISWSLHMNKLSLDFNRYKPKQTYTFEVEFTAPEPDSKIDYRRLTTAVSNVTLVKVPITTIADEPMNLGLCWNIVPLHDIDSKEIKITFEETDDMFVTKTFAGLMRYTNIYRDIWNECDIIITIKYFNEYKYDDESKKSAEKVERYRAIVKDFQHPTFNRSGNVDKVDVNVGFRVMLDDMSIKNEDGTITEIKGDIGNYISNINRRATELSKIYKLNQPKYEPLKTEDQKPNTPPAPPSSTTTPPKPTTDKPASKDNAGESGGKTGTPDSKADNTPNTGSGRSKKEFPKLKRLTNAKNFKNKRNQGDDNYFNDAASYYSTIYKSYKEWVAANNKTQDIKSAREFLIGSGVLGKNYDNTTNHMCAAGTNLQMSLAADVSTYKSYGDGANYASNFAKSKGMKAETIEFNEDNWSNAKKKIQEMCASGQYVVSLNYNNGQYGHAFTVVDGVSMSDYQHAGKAGLGVSNTAHGGCKSITIVKLA